ncbi:MAG: hypothetical protein HN356_06160 [Calditrichaeota bacterium]|nr:hypothetical protein [Calditrichota bacterium]
MRCPLQIIQLELLQRIHRRMVEQNFRAPESEELRVPILPSSLEMAAKKIRQRRANGLSLPV